MEKTPLGLYRASVENTNLSHIKPVEDKHEQMAVRMLTDEAYVEGMRGELHAVKGKLGDRGASRRAARAVLEVARTSKRVQ